MKALLGFVFLIISVSAVEAQDASFTTSLPDTPVAKALVPDNGESKPDTPSIGPADSNKNHKFSTTTKLWIASSLAVYAAAILDMHVTQETLQSNYQYKKQYPQSPIDVYWFERDPLARPLLKLPAPVYYACGIALATGVNWASLRMSRSKRFRKVWWIPQAISVAGNAKGYSTY